MHNSPDKFESLNLGGFLPRYIYELRFERVVFGNGEGLYPWKPLTKNYQNEMNFKISISNLNMESGESFRSIRKCSQTSNAIITDNIGSPSKAPFLFVKRGLETASTLITLAWDSTTTDFGGSNPVNGYINLYYQKDDLSLLWNFCCADRTQFAPKRDECTKLTGGTVVLNALPTSTNGDTFVNWKIGEDTNIVKADSDSIRLSSGYLVHEIEHGFRPYTRYVISCYVGSAILESQKTGYNFGIYYQGKIVKRILSSEDYDPSAGDQSTAYGYPTNGYNGERKRQVQLEIDTTNYIDMVDAPLEIRLGVAKDNTNGNIPAEYYSVTIQYYPATAVSLTLAATKNYYFQIQTGTSSEFISEKSNAVPYVAGSIRPPSPPRRFAITKNFRLLYPYSQYSYIELEFYRPEDDGGSKLICCEIEKDGQLLANITDVPSDPATRMRVVFDGLHEEAAKNILAGGTYDFAVHCRNDPTVKGISSILPSVLADPLCDTSGPYQFSGVDCTEILVCSESRNCTDYKNCPVDF